MSGRSGYGRSRIVGKLIHRPANMMIAGLAPKVGKPGWAIRLYYQRVNETLTSSVCEPIKIIKRIFISGDSILSSSLIGGVGLVPDSLPASSGRQAFYAIVYNRKIGWTGAISPPGNNPPPLTLNNVSLAAPSNIIESTTIIPITDYLEVLNTQLYGPLTFPVNISLGNQTTSSGYGTPAAVWEEVNTSGSTIGPTYLFGFGGGSQDMVTIITNPAHLGGYALMFNITQIINSSYSGNNNTTAGITISGSDQITFLKDLDKMTVGGNNIGIKYTAGPAAPNTGADGNLKTVEDCFGMPVSAPIGSFAIAPITGLPTIST